MKPIDFIQTFDAHPCEEAIEWIEEHPDLTLQELWDICPYGDWMRWLLYHGPYRGYGNVLLHGFSFDIRRYIPKLEDYEIKNGTAVSGVDYRDW